MTTSPQTERTTLGGSLEISRLVTGLWQLAGGHDVDFSLQDCAREMQPLIDNGLTTFDMADHYGPAEEVIGEYHALSSTNIQAFTKWCPTDPDTSFRAAEAAVDLALKRMGQQRIELLQYHIWDYSNPTYLPHLEHLHTLKEQGKIGLIGMTNTDLPHLKLLKDSGFSIVSNQVSASVIDRRIHRRGMNKWCLENGVGLLCYGTLLGGFLGEKWVGVPEPTELENWSLKKYKRFIDAAGGWEPFQVVLQTLNSIAIKHSVTIASIATRHILDIPGVAAVIVGSRLSSSSSKYIPANLQTFSFTLDESDREAILKAQEGLTDIPGENGDEYRREPFLTASGDLSHHIDPESDKIAKEIEEVTAAGGRIEVSSGSPWEPIAGYCRAVRVGNVIRVSGTTTSFLSNGKPVGGTSVASQTVNVLDIAARAITKAGGSMRDVVRTRIMVESMDGDIMQLCREHGWVFGREGVRPSNTLVGGHKLVGEGLLVEIEFEADVNSSKGKTLRL